MKKSETSKSNLVPPGSLAEEDDLRLEPGVGCKWSPSSMCAGVRGKNEVEIKSRIISAGSPVKQRAWKISCLDSTGLHHL